MSASFDVPDPLVFTAGAVGEPGARVFYLQAQASDVVVTLKCEKQQVGALAEYFAGVLADLPAIDDQLLPTRLELIDPVVAEWTVGRLAVGWDESNDRMVLIAEELLDEESVESGVEAAEARFRLSREQAASFVGIAEELIAAGRPQCPLCGGPLDPEGHACPRLN